MLPTISPHAELLLRCGDQAGPGDVIAFFAHGQVIVHRVEATGHGFILTRGDAQLLPDPPIDDLAAVIGRVVGVQESGQWRDPGSPPASAARTAVRGLFVMLLCVSPTVGAVFLRALIALRRRLVSVARIQRGASSGRGN